MDFLAMLILVVYVGAIAVLFLFIIMMLNLKIIKFRQSFLNYYYVGFLIISFFFFEVVWFLKVFEIFKFFYFFDNLFFIDWFVFINSASNLQNLGMLLYTYFYISFIFSSIILLIAMIGTITLTLIKYDSHIKNQKIFEQVIRESNLNTIVFK